jgi:integrase
MTSRAANGRSSIYCDKKGVWNGWVSMGLDENQKPVRRHVRGKTSREVSDAVAALEAQRSSTAGRAAASTKATVGEWFDEWLTIVNRTRKPKTWSTYESLIRTHCQGLRKTSMQRISIRQIDDLLHNVATTVSSRRASNLHRTLRSCFNLAVKRGRMPANPCVFAAVPLVL